MLNITQLQMPNNGDDNGVCLHQQLRTEQQLTKQDAGLPPEIWIQIALSLPLRDNISLQYTGRNVNVCAASAHTTCLREAMTRIDNATTHVTDDLTDTVDSSHLYRVLERFIKQDDDYAILQLASDKESLSKAVYEHYYTVFDRLWEINVKRAQAIIVSRFGRMRNESGMTMLHVAAERGDIETAKTLICEYDISVDILDCTGCTPIYYAAMNDNVAMVSLLAELGVNLEAVCAPNLEYTPLHTATSHGCVLAVRWLLRYGVDANKGTICNQTALHIAVREDNAHMVRLLVQNNADINALDDIGHTPLHDAVLYSNECLYALLLLHANSSSQSYLRTTALHTAITLDNRIAVHRLLARNADVNIPDINGSTALHLAMQSPSCQLWMVALQPQADFTIKDNCGYTPLDFALATIYDCNRPDKRKVYHMILETASGYHSGFK